MAPAWSAELGVRVASWRRVWDAALKTSLSWKSLSASGSRSAGFQPSCAGSTTGCGMSRNRSPQRKRNRTTEEVAGALEKHERFLKWVARAGLHSKHVCISPAALGPALWGQGPAGCRKNAVKQAAGEQLGKSGRHHEGAGTGRGRTCLKDSTCWSYGACVSWTPRPSSLSLSSLRRASLMAH